MPSLASVDPSTLEVTDIAVHAVGALIAVGFVIHLFRSGRWRDPLAEHGWNRPGANFLHVGGVMLLYVAAALVLGSGVRAGFDDESLRQAGSLGWHALQGADAVAKLLACALVMMVLAAGRPFGAETRHRLRAWRALGIGVVAAVIVLAVTTLQLQMTERVWEWAFPRHTVPVHPALEALRNSRWPGFGTAQLFIVALAVAPVAEELFFRGVLLEAVWTASRRAWLAVGVSAVAFGLMHLPQPQAVLPLTTMGLVLGYVRVRCRSLPACVLAHALFNARTMVLLYLAPELLARG